LRFLINISGREGGQEKRHLPDAAAARGTRGPPPDALDPCDQTLEIPPADMYSSLGNHCCQRRNHVSRRPRPGVKLVQNASLSAPIRRKLAPYFESECARPESGKNAKK